MKRTTITPIAIVGMGCLFPRAANVKDFWRVLFRGEDGIAEVPETHWSVDDYYHENPRYPDHTYCRRGGFLSTLPYDPAEFGIPPNTLEATDTSQLLGLLVAKKALENAGYGNGTPFDRDRTSVILGATGTQELVIPLGARLGHPIWRKALRDSGIPREKAEEVVERIAASYVSWQENSFPGLLGNVIAGRITNRLDLGGTNCVVDAACASSMSALNLAMLELASGRCDMSLTGGVDTLNDIFMHMCFSQTGVLSHTSDVRPFSEKADGTVLGEGIGILVLKRLADAEKDGDRIWAVIKAIGSSSDGKSQSIYAPNAEGQAKALRIAYRDAAVDPGTVELLEAHGTGTRVGDAVEFSALKTVFNETGDNRLPCALGSVKSNIGHTKATAGAAGLIKASLALHHKVIPATLKVDNPDPKLNIENSSFYISSKTRPWIGRSDSPRRAGVSAFGFGGSNYHVVLEEYSPEKTVVSWDGSVEIAAFSSPTQQGLADKITRFAKTAAEVSSFADIAREASKRRVEFSEADSHRLLIVLERPEDPSGTGLNAITKKLSEIADALSTSQRPAIEEKNVFYGQQQESGKIAFLFPGQGSQYPDMLSDIVCMFPEGSSLFQTADEVFRKCRPDRPERLSDFVYPYPGKDGTGTPEKLQATDIAQPAIGAASLAMFKVMEHFGVCADAVCGHSFGELTALCAAGWISEHDFLTLAAKRGQFMADTTGEKGAMLAVKAPLEDIERIIADNQLDVILANRNSNSQGVLSGSEDAIGKAHDIMKKDGFRCTLLPVSAAFHSRLVAHAAQPFAEALQGVEFNPNETAVYANSTGTPYPADGSAARKHLSEQLLQPVHFVDQIESLYKDGVRAFVEIGPKSILTGLAKSILKGRHVCVVATDSSAATGSGTVDLARTLCRLAADGFKVDLSRWEEAGAESRKPKMNIPLTGANYRASMPTIPPSEPFAPETAARPSPAAVEGRQCQRPTLKKRFQASKTPTAPPRSPSPVRAAAPDRPAAIGEALKIVSESLKSMEAIQRQTAETHKKFLEMQTESTRSLQRMMEQTRTITEDTGFLSTESFRDDHRETSNRQDAPLEMTRSQIAGERRVEVSPPLSPEAPPPADQPQETKAAPIVDAILSVVSELTGYPVDMLELSMDIEADLGIDSIKRVEILSSLEEKLPGLPPFSPDVMGELKTLGQIVDLLNKEMGSSAKPPVETKAETPKAGSGEIEAQLLQVVSELTGYPVDMLELSMDIEADLGIDSIKRVEILSSLEEKLPGLPPFSPDVMGELKTLGQIVDLLNKEMGSSAKPPVETKAETPKAGSGEIEAQLLQVASELTGYPVDMLELSMDIEADLGIDSIKRVEILSSLEEKLPGLPPFSPDVMGELKTLGQIVDLLNKEMGSSAKPPVETKAETPKAGSGEIEAQLLQVVSELTGYPVDMLELSMDIEADLGIDSIKRVEILSTFEEKVPDLPTVSAEALAELKTLGQIIRHLQKSSAGTSAPPVTVSDPQDVTYRFPAKADEELLPTEHPVERRLVSPVLQTFQPGKKIAIPADRTVYVLTDSNGVGDAVARLLAKRGIRSQTVLPELLSDPDRISRELANAGGLVLIPEVSLLTDRFNRREVWNATDDAFLKNSFQAARLLGPDLISSAKKGGALLASVTRLDGCFGFAGQGVLHPMHGGLAGLIKTARIEWPGVCCHAIDVDPEWKDAAAIAETVVDEILQPGPVEVGISRSERRVLSLIQSPAPGGRIDLTAADVVVVTGGARGVTAACTYALAKHARPAIVLLGRSPHPSSEPNWLSPLKDEGDIKKAILENQFGSEKPTPRMLQDAYRRHMANREISETLEKLKSTGAVVQYHSVDVRDRDGVAEVLDGVRRLLGPVSTVIHGAGVLEDRLIVEKTMSQFEKVFDTKVQGLHSLLQATEKDPLKYMIFFSSVSARVGNNGQVDYAMANEVLNKIAQQEAVLRDGCRVISINWGPWDGGMVSPTLKREFERQHIRLIPINEGSLSMIYEMMAKPTGPVEVVIGASFELPQQQEAGDTAGSPETVPADTTDFDGVFTQIVSTEDYPVLNSHVLGGKPVVPFAVMAEWFAHSALEHRQGMTFCGIDDMRLLSGIKIDGEPKEIRLQSSDIQMDKQFCRISLELRNGTGSDASKLHARAVAVLAENQPEAPPAKEWKQLAGTPYPMSPDQAYEQVLFHGKELRGIREIIGYSDKGMVARLGVSPAPGLWLASPYRKRWVTDPLLLDAAFQMAILWCFETTGNVSLPSYCASYRQFCSAFPQEVVTAVLEIQEWNKHKMRGDFMFLGPKDETVAVMTGYEAVMDPSLMKAFKP